MAKQKRTQYNIAVNTADSYKNSGFYQYLYISKLNWFDLLDTAGNKLVLPPTWYDGSTVNLEYRTYSHDLKMENPTEIELKRSLINQYLRKNNLILDVNYYFDVYVMIQTEYIFILSLENLIDRQQQIKYKTTIENYMKHNMHEYFLLDGEPIINRFSDIWGIDGIEYKKYSIEKVVPHYKPTKATIQRLEDLKQFNNMLSEKKLDKLYTNAFTVHTGAEALNLINQHNKQFRKQISRDEVTKYRVMF